MSKYFARLAGLLVILGIIGAMAYMVLGGYQNYKYKSAALRIEAAYGEYVDVTFLGHPPKAPSVLAYVIILEQIFPGVDSPDWLGYDAMWADEMRALIKNEKAIVVVLLKRNDSGAIYPVIATEMSTQLLMAGNAPADSIINQGPISGMLPAKPFLKWINK